MAFWREHRESEIEIELVVCIHAVGPNCNIDCIMRIQLTERSVERLPFLASANEVGANGLFVDQDAKQDVSLKIAVVPADGAVGDRIEAVIGDGESDDGIDVECAALGFASARVTAVSGNSDVGTGLGPRKIGIIVGAVS